jgi:hypothetical protein
MVAIKRIKKKEHEKLSDSNIAKVADLLENGISKKDACEILNISYNTTRLSTIIENWKSEKELIIKRKKEKRGKPAQPAEVRNIVESYLSGVAIHDIAKRVYRTPGFVKNTVQRIGIPERVTGEDKYKVSILPEECIAEQFEVGEIAWSAVYHAPCEVRGVLNQQKYDVLYNTPCYRIYIIENVDSNLSYVNAGGFNAFSASYDLGKLNHLKELGIDLKKL